MGIWNADKLLLEDSNGAFQEFAESAFAAALTVAAGLTATYTELNRLAGVVAGTVAASKALVVDANKDLSALRNLTLTNLDAGASGTAGTVDVFPSTASKGKTSFTATDNAGDTTTTITTAAQAGARTYTIPDGGASANVLLTTGAATATSATTTEISNLAGVVAGTATASKAAVLGANKNLDTIVIADSGLKLGSGAGTAVTATAAELNAVADGEAVDATIAVGAEAGDAISCSVQLKDGNGTNLAVARAVDVWISGNASGDALVGTAPNGGVTFGGGGVIAIEPVADKLATVLSSTAGAFTVILTDSGTPTFYVVVKLPTGKLVISSAVTFA